MRASEQAEAYRPTFWDTPLPLTAELKKKVREYHEFHGDKTGYAVKVVRAADGYPAVLARAVTAQGRKISAILMVDSQGDVSEHCSCPRECEAMLVADYAAERDWDDNTEGE